MSTLSTVELAMLAGNAGFTGNDVGTAVAVALAESGGNTNAHNSTPPDDSYGLWQINMYGNLGPERRKEFGISSNTALYNPSTNADAAHKIFKSDGWSAWSTYNNGEYKKHLTQPSSGGLLQDAKNTLSGIGKSLDVGSAIAGAGSKIFTGIADVAAVFVALTLLALGVLILSRKNVGTVTKNATKVAKVAAL